MTLSNSWQSTRPTGITTSGCVEFLSPAYRDVASTLQCTRLIQLIGEAGYKNSF